MAGVLRSQAIKRFLEAKTHSDLAKLYHAGMECQLNVAQDDGERKESDSAYGGIRTVIWTDGVQSWSSFRIPKNAMSDPEDNDFEIHFEIDKHAEAIGMTGWDWKECKSRWVAFDFDAIAGHSEKHASTLTDKQLEDVKVAACKIPWVTVRKSTGGKGLHLYVFVDGVDSKNHNEHAALARSILGMMSAITGFDFGASVDVCGSNIWVWGRKMAGTDGLSLIKQGEVLYDVPPNWRDHIKVTASRGKVRNLPQFIEEREMSLFEELAGQRLRVPLDDDHKKLIEFLTERKAFWWWDNDHHMLVTHTWELRNAHQKLSLRGLFDTVATGRQAGGDHNCFCFPMRRGAWVVRRYGKGIQEHECWEQDQNGYTRAFLNRDPDLQTASRSHGGVELESGGFEFREAEVAVQAAAELGAQIKIPNAMNTRNATLKAHRKDGRLIFKIKKEATDNPKDMLGWKEEKDKTWTKILNIKVDAGAVDADTANYDDMVRHLITETGDDCGWVIKGGTNTWNGEPLAHVKVALGSMGIGGKQIGEVLGASVIKCWRIVNRPFQPEYVGDRQWNRNSAQFRFTPSAELDKLSFPHWSRILRHTGSGLDDAVRQNKWCQDNGVNSGHDYLMLWCSSLFREPLKKLPYLFFYGPQNSGKSILHIALGLLFEKKRGYIRADAALTSPSAFNGEMENAVLCVVEETDLSKQSSTAYNRIKDWTTSPDILIHKKNQTPYTIPNSCHFIQVANSKDNCPVFKDDTRITMGYVESLQPGEEIEFNILISSLEKEAPDFLAHILSIEIPQHTSRLRIPVINTQDKMDAAKANQTQLECFIDECCFRVDGEAVKLGELYTRFKDWLDPMEAENWTKQRMTRELPQDLPKGRFRGADWHIGNLSFVARNSDSEIKHRLVADNEKLVSVNG